MANYEIDTKAMLEIFLFETNQQINQLEEIIIQCEKDKEFGAASIHEVFRIMHTIKGSSGMMRFDNLSLLAHSLEDLFSFIRKKTDSALNYEKLSDLVLSAVDFVKEEIRKITENGYPGTNSTDELVISINCLLEELKGSDVTIKLVPMSSLRKYCVRIFFKEDCQMENVRGFTIAHHLKDVATDIYHLPENIIDEECCGILKNDGFFLRFCTEMDKQQLESFFEHQSFLSELNLQEVNEYPSDMINFFKPRASLPQEIITQTVSHQSPVKEPVLPKERVQDTPTTKRQQNMISVNISKLDVLMDVVGEIVTSEAMVSRNPDLAGLQLDSFNKAARQLRKLTKELQDIVMSIRMVPIAGTFQKMNRLIRDMSKKLNKEAELIIFGENTEVDKNIIDHLTDPLMHLIRNALDHGLENAEERVQKGKPAIGRITLEAKSVGGDVWIVIRDDGRGLDREKILEKAKEHGLTDKPDNELTNKEIFSYILLPGFSTKQKVTEFSGRGVGMDVVKQNIEKISGTISIDSSPGLGTEMVIKIPLTLSIIDGMEVSVGNAKYIIPITSIRESFKVSDTAVIADSAGNELVMVRGQCYPVYRLYKMFGIHTSVHSIDDGIMVMVENMERNACFFVDALLGEQQVVVKALPNYFSKVDGITGCSILGDGGLSLIVDVNGMLA